MLAMSPHVVDEAVLPVSFSYCMAERTKEAQTIGDDRYSSQSTYRLHMVASSFVP